MSGAIAPSILQKCTRATGTQFISGTLDGRTPAANVDAASAGFERAYRLTLEGADHDDDLWRSHPDISVRITAFFAGATPADASLQAPPLTFATSVTVEILRALWQRVGLAGSGHACFSRGCPARCGGCASVD